MVKQRTYIKEADVKNEIKSLLKKHDYFYWMPAANGYGVTGVSDFNCLRNGVFIAIEAKFGGNKPSAMQRAYLSSILAAGGFGFVVDEKRVDTLRQWLEAFDRSMKDAATTKKMADEDGALMLECIRVMTEEIA